MVALRLQEFHSTTQATTMHKDFTLVLVGFPCDTPGELIEEVGRKVHDIMEHRRQRSTGICVFDCSIVRTMVIDVGVACEVCSGSRWTTSSRRSAPRKVEQRYHQWCTTVQSLGGCAHIAGRTAENKRLKFCSRGWSRGAARQGETHTASFVGSQRLQC